MMTKSNNDELFNTIMARWVNYFYTVQLQDEAAKTGESIFGKIFDFRGDLPESGKYKPETIGARVDLQRRYRISHEERQAADVLNKVPARLVVFIKVDALYSQTYSQIVIAAALGLSLDQYKRRKTSAKKLAVYFAKLAAVRLPKNYILCGC